MQSKGQTIMEIDESEVESVRAMEEAKPASLNKEQLGTKRQILRKFYSCRDEKQRSIILGEWPSSIIKALFNEHGVMEVGNGVYFIGRVVNNLIQGFALVVYSQGRFYEGEFQNNYKHGSGFEYLRNGVYIGSFVNNKPEGKGAFYWNNEEAYEGEFLAGMKHGSGRWTSKYETYVGEWKLNKPDGQGVIVTRESRYEGQVKAGLKHGYGYEMFKNGDKYVGHYINGRPEGHGQYIWARNRSTYRGEFKNGLRHGNGLWIQGGDRYQGHYLNDRKNGKGIFTWASGNRYVGSYFDDLRHGYGEMTWTDGSWYKGQWKFGVQHGQGEAQECGRPPKRGIFQNNVLVSEEERKTKNNTRQTTIYDNCFRPEQEKLFKTKDLKAEKKTSRHPSLPINPKRQLMKNPLRQRYARPKAHSTSCKIKTSANSEDESINMIHWANITPSTTKTRNAIFFK